MLRTIKNNALMISLFVGLVFYKIVGYAAFTTPYILFFILLLTFSKISVKDLKITKLHLAMLTVQILGGIAAYYAFAWWNPIVAQGALICVMCPTAASAAVITSKLGGNIANITTFTLISNLTVGLVIPLLFPLIIESNNDMTFIVAFYNILKKLFPLLMVPFLLAQFIRYALPKVNTKISSISGLSFYLWAIALTIVTGQTLQSILSSDAPTETLVGLGLVSLFSCIILFSLGKAMGIPSGYELSSGQSLGQKNTILAMWICHTYLNPITSLGPGLYVLWQNTFNSWQIYQYNKKGCPK